MQHRVPIATRVVLLGLAAAVVLLCAIPWFVTDARARELLYAEEAGLFEQTSIVLWLLLAAGLFAILRPITGNVVAAAVTCVFAAAREASWHKAFTGESVLKFSYYLDSGFPLLQRVLIGAVVLVGIFCLGVTVLTVIRHARAGGWFRAAWVRLFLIFLAVGVVSKVFDRSPAILDETFGLILWDLPREMMQSCEEGLEMVLPVLVGVAAMVFARSRATHPETPALAATAAQEPTGR